MNVLHHIFWQTKYAIMDIFLMKIVFTNDTLIYHHDQK